jgi:hypothetical protein
VEEPKRGEGKVLRNEIVVGSEKSSNKKRKRNEMDSEESDHEKLLEKLGKSSVTGKLRKTESLERRLRDTSEVNISDAAKR